MKFVLKNNDCQQLISCIDNDTTFLQTKYKNIQEKFKEKKYDSVSNFKKYLI